MKTITPAPAGLVQPYVPLLCHTTELSKECGGTTDQYGLVPFSRSGGSTSGSFVHQLFRLLWPGEARSTTMEDNVGFRVRVVRGSDDPAPMVLVDLGRDLVQALGDGNVDFQQFSWSLSDFVHEIEEHALIDAVASSDNTTDQVRYHIDVNRWLYGTFQPPRPSLTEPDTRTGTEGVLRAPFSVGPLTAEMVDEVLDARFALPNEIHRDAGLFRIIIENLVHSPLLAPGTTSGTGHLLMPTLAASLRAYFELLADHMYDHVSCWWLRDRRLWAEKAMILFMSRFWSVGPKQLLIFSGVLNSEGVVRDDILVSSDPESVEYELYRSCDDWIQRELGIELTELWRVDDEDNLQQRHRVEMGAVKTETPKVAPGRRLVGEISSKPAPQSTAELEETVSAMRANALQIEIGRAMGALQPVHMMDPLHYKQLLERYRGEAMDRGAIGTVRVIDVEIDRVAKIITRAGRGGAPGVIAGGVTCSDPIPRIEIAAADNPAVAPEVLRVLGMVRSELGDEALDTDTMGLAMVMLERIREIFEIDEYPPKKIPLEKRGEIERQLIVEAVTLYSRMEKIVQEKSAMNPQSNERDEDLEALMAEVGEDDTDLDGEPVGGQGVVGVPVTDPATERVRAPMSMPYDTGDARSAVAGDGHRQDARIAMLLKSIAETGATADEVKEVFPELSDLVDRALADRASVAGSEPGGPHG